MSDESRQNVLNRIRIRKDLEKFTGGALERHGRVDDLIVRIAALDPDDQEFICEWSRLIARSNNELAAHFVTKVPSAFEAMDSDGVLDWVDQAMTVFDNRGLGLAIEVLEEPAVDRIGGNGEQRRGHLPAMGADESGPERTDHRQSL